MAETDFFPAPTGPFFKYRSLNGPDDRPRLEQLLVRSEIYFSGPAGLNDPFEGHVAPDFDSPEALIRQFWLNYPSHVQALPMERFEVAVSRNVEAAESPEGQRALTATAKAIVAATGIACFAESPAIVPMWSYYSAAHTGLCLRFRHDTGFMPWAFRGGILGKVRYAPSYPSVKYFESSTAEFVQAILFTKGADWAHENEWRIIRNGGIGVLAVPAEYIDCVILGARMSLDDRAFVRSVIGQRAVPTEILEARIDERSFDLTIVPADTP